MQKKTNKFDYNKKYNKNLGLWEITKKMFN